MLLYNIDAGLVYKSRGDAKLAGEDPNYLKYGPEFYALAYALVTCDGPTWQIRACLRVGVRPGDL